MIKKSAAKKQSLAVRLMRPITWSYITLILGALGLTTMFIVGLLFETVYLEAALIVVWATLGSAGILMLTWAASGLALLRQVKNGSGTTEQLTRRIDDFNLPVAPKTLVDAMKLHDMWQANGHKKPVMKKINHS